MATSQEELSSPLMPVVVVTILAFVISSVFMAIVEMIIDTTMIAFCEDCDRNDGHPLK